MLIATQLYVGRGGAIDGIDAIRYHGVRAVAVDDNRVYAVTPWQSTARNRGFVVVRRSTTPIQASAGLIRYVDPAPAIIAATRRMRGERRVLAVMSDALQRRIVNYEELTVAHIQGSPRNTRLADGVLDILAGGVLSVTEADFKALADASLILPPLDYNVWLRLQSGLVVCVDALDESAALVHESNGRKAHAREDLFEDMQERHDALTVAGFAALHNSPRRIGAKGRIVIAEMEACHKLYAGRGMPAGVQRIEPPDHLAA